MLRLLNILWNSFKMSLGELKNNKLRSGLSLTGVAFGIFCIISVLALVNSLEYKIQSDIASLGSNTIYIDKLEYAANEDNDFPWWKFVNRPIPKFQDVKYIKERSTLADKVAYFVRTSTDVSYKNSELQDMGVNGVSNEFNQIQTISIVAGRYFNANDFTGSQAIAVIGNVIATELFGNVNAAIDKIIEFDGHKVTVIGVIEKQGQNFAGYDFDHDVLLSYYYFASVYVIDENLERNFIIVKGKPNVSSEALSDELKGVMRQVRRLSPKQEDNFAVNDVKFISEAISGFFGTVNLGGWAIAGLSLIVGGFGVANIMFVTVRERTSQIGLKKLLAQKAKQSY